MCSSLEQTEVIVVDCQTTGATPRQGQVIELAWCRTSAAAVDNDGKQPIQTHLVSLDPEQSLPPRVAKITGIGLADLHGGTDPERVWRQLESELSALSAHGTPLFVAHFARFEQLFLADLAQKWGSVPVPFDFVCTYEAARRIYPDLPKLSIRALAGYLGHHLPQRRRAADHVAATLHIWVTLVAELKSRLQITEWDDLTAFLAQPPRRRSDKALFPMPADRRRALPAKPGVYRFYDQLGQLLYVGKATSLKQRVGSYFQSTKNKADHIREMLAQAFDIDYTESQSPLEAALAEGDEIKQLDPPYNRALRIAENNVWFCSADFARIDVNGDNGCSCGPFPSPAPIQALHVISALLRDRIDQLDVATTLAPLQLPYGEDLTADLLQEAVGRLKGLFFELSAGDDSPRGLLALGCMMHQFWQRERTARKAEEATDPPPLQPVDPSWTPQRLARHLTRIVAHTASLWQRSCWLKMLSEANLVWQPTGTPGPGSLRLLIIEQGCIHQARAHRADAPIPRPRYEHRTQTERGARFDRLIYDRLRVLTTELRRLLAQGQPVQLRLSTDRTLDPIELSRILGGL